MLRQLASIATVAFLTSCGGSSERGSAPTSADATTSRPAVTTTTTPAEPVTAGFIAFGDFGGGTKQDAVAGAMRAWAAQHRVDALVTTGDNVYPSGEPSLFHAYLDVPYAPLHVPMWATLGNHDVHAGHGNEELDHLGLPHLPYTKTLGPVELLFVDANHPDQVQARWLDEQLGGPGPLFRIVVFHQPAYSCGLHGSTKGVDDNWVSVFEKHAVPLVLNGHDHDYQRFTSPRGVTYLVTGGGGKDLYVIKPVCSGVPRRETFAVRHHFVGVEISAHALAVTAVADDGTVLDRATITR